MMRTSSVVHAVDIHAGGEPARVIVGGVADLCIDLVPRIWNNLLFHLSIAESTMNSTTELSRRERQIMDSLFSREGATVAEVRGDLPNPPVNKAVRRMLHILEENSYVTRRKIGKQFVYLPRATKRRAGVEALRHVLDTFFDGAVDQAFAAHLATKESEVTGPQLKEMRALIDKARKEDR
jgi:predicted transcriptional regulator